MRSPQRRAAVRAACFGFRWVAAVAALAAVATSAVAEDTVYLSGSGGGQTKLTGEVLDYTGRELLLELPDGQRRSLSPEKVVRVETTYSPQQTQADGLFARNEFESALALYGKALDFEPRRWVRREIIARCVRCQAELDRPAQAGETFLLLVRDDPATIHFDCIPLGWTPRQTPVEVEAAARQWVIRSEPAAQLLGASYLLTGRSRAEVLRMLRGLMADADRRIALLAMAQTWRADVATATGEEIDGWAGLIEQIPEPLAAGPYFVLGQARAQRGDFERAALAWLRVAILYPQQRHLVAPALVEAGRALERIDQTPEAVRLYREAIGDYPEQTRAVAEAQSRLDELARSQPSRDAPATIP